MLQVQMDVLCCTNCELVYYLLLMLPNLPIVAQQPARAVSTGEINLQSASATFTQLGEPVSRSIFRPVGLKLVYVQPFIFCPRYFS